MSNDHSDLTGVAAAIELLKTIPTTWTPVPQLSHAKEAALGLLTSAGLVERRVHLRLRTAGKPEAVDFTFQFYGQAGLAQAAEPATAEAWALWGLNQTVKPQVYVECPDGAGDWRLTDQGVTAQDEANRGETTYLRDFLRTPGLPGTEGMKGPLRFVPGVWRPMVHGEGHVLSVKVVGAAAPLNVHVDNMVELSGPLEGMIDRFLAAVASSTAATPPLSAPADLCAMNVAVAEYQTTRSTIRRRIKDGKLHDYREKTARKNAAIMLSRAELSNFFPHK